MKLTRYLSEGSLPGISTKRSWSHNICKKVSLQSCSTDWQTPENLSMYSDTCNKLDTNEQNKLILKYFNGMSKKLKYLLHHYHEIEHCALAFRTNMHVNQQQYRDNNWLIELNTPSKMRKNILEIPSPTLKPSHINK